MRLDPTRYATAIAIALAGTLAAGFTFASPPHGSSERWSSRYFADSPISDAYDIEVHGSVVYVAGIAIGPGTRDLVRWDGRSWTSIAPNLGWYGVHALEMLGDDLYVAGSFAEIAGTQASLVARWDGQTWHPLGSGINELAYDLHVWNGALYVCGRFDEAGGVAVNGVARWDGEAWSAVGDGPPVGEFPGVSDLDSTADTLYAINGGKVVQWDGQDWAWLVPQIPGYASHLAVVGDDLYVAGQLYPGYQDDNRAVLLRWDGEQWHDESDGLSPEPDFWIYDLAVVGSVLYVAENLRDDITGVLTPRLKSFDGTHWSLVGDEFLGSYSPNGPVSFIGGIGTLEPAGDSLLVGGTFDRVGNLAAPRLAKWDGTKWRAFGYSGGLAPNSQVRTMGLHDDRLFIGGRFGTMAGFAAGGIASWDGVTWSPVGGGTDGEVSTFFSDGDDLYVGGDFAKAGGVVANSIARWNGSGWSAVGEGFRAYSWSGRVYGIARWNGDLYAAGAFSKSGSERADSIAKWDGTKWVEVGGGMYGVIDTMAAMDEGLYVGGDIDYEGSDIKRWDGTSFIDIEGFDGVLRMLVASEHGLIVAGGLNQTGDVHSPGIVLYDGEKFVAWPVPLPNGTGVGAVALSGTDVFVSAYGVDGQYVARWDGAEWTSFGATVGDRFAVAAYGGSLFVGGSISEAGGKPSYHLARYRYADPVEVCGDMTGDEVLTSSDALGVLRAAVGTVECSLTVCDFNGDSDITASDALATLQAAVGLPVPALCN